MALLICLTDLLRDTIFTGTDDGEMSFVCRLFVPERVVLYCTYGYGATEPSRVTGHMVGRCTLQAAPCEVQTDSTGWKCAAREKRAVHCATARADREENLYRIFEGNRLAGT